MNYRLNISNKEGKVIIDIPLEKDCLAADFLLGLWQDFLKGAPYVVIEDRKHSCHSIPLEIMESCVCSIIYI
jgi:hypothetical protein